MILVIAAVVGVVVAHEAGHAAAAQMLGLPWKPVLGRWGRPGIRIGSDDRRLTRRERAITAAAGPVVSIALGVALWTVNPFVAVVSLDLAFWNLILPSSDGAAVLRALRGATYERSGR